MMHTKNNTTSKPTEKNSEAVSKDLTYINN